MLRGPYLLIDRHTRRKAMNRHKTEIHDSIPLLDGIEKPILLHKMLFTRIGCYSV